MAQTLAALIRETQFEHALPGKFSNGSTLCGAVVTVQTAPSAKSKSRFCTIFRDWLLCNSTAGKRKNFHLRGKYGILLKRQMRGR